MQNGEMSPERWAEIDALFDAALDLPTRERSVFVETATVSDERVRTAVQRLLEAHHSDGGPLHETGERAAAQWAASIVASNVTEGATQPPTVHVMPERIGPWRLLRVAGEGGMGTVYEAERADGAFEMRVALKLVRRGLHGDANFKRRLQHERRILARLEHPGIARLLDAGVTDDGLPWYVMEYVDGVPIDRFCIEHELTRGQRVALMAQVADAVADAHDARIVHRDLKPGNILVSDDGTPKLVDFGIAKVLEDNEAGSPVMTHTGHRLLTPAYASPEQIRGDSITPATDVWALGVVLYELLTGQHPFSREGMTTFELERAIVGSERVPPSRVGGRTLRGDLDAIVLTALHEQAHERYATAAGLADDLRRHLDGQTVRARRESVPYRARRFLARHRVAAAATAVGIVIGVAGLVIADRVRSPFDATAPARSALALRFYQLGLTAMGTGRYAEATRRFEEAVAEDSTFAIAAFYGADAATRDENYATARRLLDIAEREAAHVPGEEGLFIRANLAERARSPAMHVLAESLLVAHPASSRVQLLAARAAFWRGEYEAALRRYLQVASAQPRDATQPGPCDACEARIQVVNMYLWADSLDRAEAEAAALVQRDSLSADAWRYAALVGLYKGSHDDVAYRRALALDPDAVDWSAEWLASRYIRQGRFPEADQILRGHMATAPEGRRDRSHWLLITSLRYQERFDEAYALAREFRANASTRREGSAPVEAVHEALVLLERGQAHSAAALFDSISRAALAFDQTAVTSTSTRIWHLAHAASAYAAAGDTARLPMLRDSIATLSEGSGIARDWKLTFHIDGLLHAARGDHDAAARAFQRAIISPNQGYTRTNLALSRSLLALGRTSEAIATLRSALRGSLEVNNLYVTHTALHEQLAEAWEQAGNVDSAMVHREWVRRATGRP